MEEPDKYFENAFLVDCHEFIINIDYPITMTAPVVYDVNIESHEKNYCDIQPAIIESNNERTCYSKMEKKKHLSRSII